MSEPVQIGLREVYDVMVGLREDFGSHKHATDLRLLGMERDIQDLQSKDAERGQADDTKSNRRWSVTLVGITAALGLVSSIVTPLVLR